MPLVVSVDLDAVAVGVGHLNAHETPVVLPLRLDNARCPEAVAHGADGSLVRQPEAKWFVRGSSPTYRSSTLN